MRFRFKKRVPSLENRFRPGKSGFDGVDPDREHRRIESFTHLVVQGSPVISSLRHEAMVPMCPEGTGIIAETVEQFPFTTEIRRQKVELIGLHGTDDSAKRA